VQLIVFVAVALAVAFLLNRTAYGTKLYALGTNATAATFSGVNSTSLLIRTYLLSGLFAAIAGLVMLANYNSAKADYGLTYTLLTVLIVVLGGVNPNGGSGRLIGVVLAVAILQILSSGLNMFPEISNFYRPLIWGSVLLLVVSTSGSNTRGMLGRLRTRKESRTG
jgi:simple sugar transport system permease protein